MAATIVSVSETPQYYDVISFDVLQDWRQSSNVLEQTKQLLYNFSMCKVSRNFVYFVKYLDRYFLKRTCTKATVGHNNGIFRIVFASSKV